MSTVLLHVCVRVCETAVKAGSHAAVLLQCYSRSHCTPHSMQAWML